MRTTPSRRRAPGRVARQAAAVTATACLVGLAALGTAPAAHAATTTPTPSATLSTGLEAAVASTVILQTASGHGSGVYLGEGRILTAAHVVDAGTVAVRGDRSLGTAEVVQRDRGRDLAVVALTEDAGLTPVRLRTDPARVGEQAYTAGSPTGDYVQLTAGIVSAVVQQNGVTRVQTDAPVNPGNSGGPLLDAAGDLLGIVVTKSASEEGMGWATSSAEITAFLGGDVGAAADDETGSEHSAPATPTVPAGAPAAGLIVPVAAVGLGGASLALLAARRRRPRAAGPVLDLSDLSSPPPPTAHHAQIHPNQSTETLTWRT